MNVYNYVYAFTMCNICYVHILCRPIYMDIGRIGICEMADSANIRACFSVQ